MCQFIIPFPGASEQLMNQAKTEIEKTGGSFNGDQTGGVFEVKTVLGRIGGSYKIAGQEIEISVHKKPLLVSCRKIEKELNAIMG
jgi:hypothetical protein